MGKWIPQFKIGGVSVPIPSNYSQVLEDLSSDESGRVLSGKMRKDVVAVKTSVPLEWFGLEWEKAAQISKLVDGKSSVMCEYMDIRNPYKMTSKEIYVGVRNCELSYFDTDGKVYWDLSFNEIEV